NACPTSPSPSRKRRSRLSSLGDVSGMGFIEFLEQHSDELSRISLSRSLLQGGEALRASIVAPGALAGAQFVCVPIKFPNSSSKIAQLSDTRLTQPNRVEMWAEFGTQYLDRIWIAGARRNSHCNHQTTISVSLRTK